MIEADLVAYLLANAGLKALVADRIRPTKIPPVKLGLGYPCVLFFTVTGSRDHTHDAVDGLRYPHFQFNCWAKTYKDAKLVAAAVAAALDNYRGTLGGTVRTSFQVEDVADLGSPSDLAVGTDVPSGVRVEVRAIHAPS